MKRRIARFPVSRELIAQSLGMPDDAKILAIVQDEVIPNAFIFFVEHKDLPEVDDGEPLPRSMPVITVDNDKRPSTWVTWNWNIPRDEDGGYLMTYDALNDLLPKIKDSLGKR